MNEHNLIVKHSFPQTEFNSIPVGHLCKFRDGSHLYLVALDYESKKYAVNLTSHRISEHCAIRQTGWYDLGILTARIE